MTSCSMITGRVGLEIAGYAGGLGRSGTTTSLEGAGGTGLS
jgi:hypothetical protein